MKRLPEDTFTKLCKFIGYGNLEAPVWFIGPEERLLEETEEANCATPWDSSQV